MSVFLDKERGLAVRPGCLGRPGCGSPCLTHLFADALGRTASPRSVFRMLDLPSRRGVWPGTTAEDLHSDLETLADLRPSP